MKKIFGACLSLFVFGSPANADVQNDLGTFFRSLEGSANANSAEVYKDQTAGYYTGGSLFARNTVHTSDLVNLRLPGYRAGCGGIDMHFGALSFIGSEQLKNALKAIGANMGSYALMLALETMSPQVKNIISELNDLAQRVNQSNINSCELAATTLGAMLPQSEIAGKHLCTMIGSDRQYGNFTDYAAARQGCGAGGDRNKILAQGKQDPRFAKMLGTEFNLAWKAIQENAFLQSDKKLAAFFMSLSGTIVSTENGGGYDIRTFASLADNNTLLNALLNGGEAPIYACQDVEGSHCLKMGKEKLTITHDKALVNYVKEILISIQNKIYDDQPLSDAEKGFLNSTRLPLYKMLSVLTAYKRGSAPIDVGDYAELAAVDILFQYLSEILDVIHESMHHLRASQVDDTQIKRFQEGLTLARQKVDRKRLQTYEQVEQLFGFLKKTEMIEKMVSTRLGVIADEGF